MTDFSNLVRQANLINAQWVGADDAGTFAVINPATAETIAHVPNCGATESRRAIAAANATEYGLATYAYTRDLARAFRLQDRLDYGLIGINEVFVVSPENPFGGLKESGLGQEGAWQGMDDYLSTKFTCIGGL